MNDGLIDGRNLRVRRSEEINKREGIKRLRACRSVTLRLLSDFLVLPFEI